MRPPLAALEQGPSGAHASLGTSHWILHFLDQKGMSGSTSHTVPTYSPTYPSTWTLFLGDLWWRGLTRNFHA